MPIQEFFDIIKIYCLVPSRRLIPLPDFDINAVHPEMKFRAIDYAAKIGGTSKVEYLYNNGAELFPRPDQDVIAPNIALALVLSLAYGAYEFLTTPKVLSLLEKKGITIHHLNAAFAREPNPESNLSCEDLDGLLPAHYAALSNNRNLSKWIPAFLKMTFPNYRLTKGKYAGTSGAWWLASGYNGAEFMLASPQSCIDQLTIHEQSTFYINESQSLLFKLLKTAYGKGVLGRLPDIIFNNINWNQREKGVPAAWHMAFLLHDEVRLFKLPKDKLIEIDWNATPSEDQPQSDQTVVSHFVGLGIYKTCVRQLIMLPTEVLNNINWLVIHKSDIKKYTIIQKIVFSLEDDEILIFLAKLSLDKIVEIYKYLPEKDLTLHFVCIDLLRKLFTQIPSEPIPKGSFDQKLCQKLLANIAGVFQVAHSDSKQEERRLKGIKGQILFRISINPEYCTELLNLQNPFFKINASYSFLNDVDKVRALATQYLMQGEKTDRIQGRNIIAPLFQKASMIQEPTPMELSKGI